MAPVATSSASTSVVLPEPEWPTSATLRTPPGWSAIGAPPAAVDALLSVIVASCPFSCVRPAFTRWPPDHKPPARIAGREPAPVGCARWIFAVAQQAGDPPDIPLRSD